MKAWQSTELTLNLQFLVKHSSNSCYLHTTKAPSPHPSETVFVIHFVAALLALSDHTAAFREVA